MKRAGVASFAAGLCTLAGFFLLGGAVPLTHAGSAPPATGRTIEVTPETFDAAMRAAQPGDTLLLADGEYSPQARIASTDSRSAAAESTAAAATAAPSPTRYVFLQVSGREGYPITMRAAGKAAVFRGGVSVGGSWIVIDGIRVGWAKTGAVVGGGEGVTIRNCDIGPVESGSGIWVHYAKHLTIEHNDIHDATSHGIALHFDTTGAVIRDNYIHDNGNAAVYLDAESRPGEKLRDIVVERNRICHNGSKGSSAIACMNVVDSVFRNNLLYKNEAGGICFNKGPYDPNVYFGGVEAPTLVERVRRYIKTLPPTDNARNRIVCNTVYMEPGKGRYALKMTEKCTRFYVQDNIFVGGKFGTVFVAPESMRGLSMDNNLIATYEGQLLYGDDCPEDPSKTIKFTIGEWRKKGYDRHSVFPTDAGFVSVVDDDYRLMPGSTAIDAGCDVSRFCPTDFEDVKRPQGRGYDCGAYEYMPPTNAKEASKK